MLQAWTLPLNSSHSLMSTMSFFTIVHPSLERITERAPLSL